jgi:hypothetical protein
MSSDAMTAAYDTCGARLDAGDPNGAVIGLAKDLAALRGTVPPDEWRELACASRDNPVHRRLLEDPYLRDAFLKPRGYPGDAHTLDFIYGHRDADSTVTTLGRVLLGVSTGVPIADAVRARRDYIGHIISQTARRRPNAVIGSIACGFMRELHRCDADVSGVQFIGMDHDARTIAALPDLHPGVHLRGQQMSVRSILTGKVELDCFDLLYASGLYDYLDDQTACALTARLVDRLRPAGQLVIANLTPANEEIACMEAVWDWWMIYRDRRGMASLLSGLNGARDSVHATTSQIADGRIACLTIKRLR